VLLIPLCYHRERNTVQHWASRRKETGLDMRHLQSPATLRITRPHTRNEVRSAVRVRSSALSKPLSGEAPVTPAREMLSLTPMSRYPPGSEKASGSLLNGRILFTGIGTT
jgi:hypothetical protein